MKKFFGKFVLACVAAVVVVNTACANTITVNTNAQGWVNSSGQSNGASNGNNTFTGVELGKYYNSVANYDLTSVSGTVVSATLDITLANWDNGFGNLTGPNTLGIYDVNTPLSSFQSFSPGVAGYNDLGSGNLYGTVTGYKESHLITLSAQAVADINAALGGNFLLGFTNWTQNSLNPNTNDIGIYINGAYMVDLINQV